MFVFFLIFFLFSTFLEVIAEESFDRHSSLEIVPKTNLLFDKEYYYFGVKITLAEGWKTYWKNPGEAGAPLSIDFNDNPDILENEILFPFPKKFTDYDIETIGYEKEIIFPIKLKLNENKKKLISKINLQYLVCKDICIPISIERNLNHSLNKYSENIKKSILYNYLEKVPSKNVNYFLIKNLKKISDNKISFSIDNLNLDKINVFAFSDLSSLSTKTYKKKSQYSRSYSRDKFNEDEIISLAISNGKKMKKFK